MGTQPVDFTCDKTCFPKLEIATHRKSLPPLAKSTGGFPGNLVVDGCSLPMKTGFCFVGLVVFDDTLI